MSASSPELPAAPLRRPRLSRSTVAVRLAWALLAVQAGVALRFSGEWENLDSSGYLALAEALSHGKYGYAAGDGFTPDALRPPGYPLLLCVFHEWLRLPLGGLAALQLAAYLASLGLLARLLATRGLPGWPLLWAGVCYPFSALYAARSGTEAPCMLLVAAMAVVLARSRLDRRGSVALGVLAGAAALVRSDLLLLAPFAAVVSGLEPGEWGLRERLWRAGLVVGASGLVLAPYAVYNRQTWGRFTPVPVAAAVGNSLFLATWQARLPSADLRSFYLGEISPRARASGLIDEVTAANREIGAPDLTPLYNPAFYATPEQQRRSSRVLLAMAVHRIRRDPGPYVRHVLGNLWRLWVSTEALGDLPGTARAGLTALMLLAWVAGTTGAVLAVVRRDWPVPAALGWLLFYFPLVHVWLHTEARYTAAARPLLLLHGAVLVGVGVSAWRGRRLRAKVAPAQSEAGAVEPAAAPEEADLPGEAEPPAASPEPELTPEPAIIPVAGPSRRSLPVGKRRGGRRDLSARKVTRVGPTEEALECGKNWPPCPPIRLPLSPA